MTFLPIVDRELRVAARRKSTYRIRAWTAVVALGVGFVWSAMGFMARGPSGYGKLLYTGLTGFLFALCLLAGVLLTADCLSEEKREGTMGLLFLTDLKGYDVVLGKMLAAGLNALYGLLAVLPLTGLCLLLGGLTGGEFWRMNLALVNALFFSMVIGMLVSALGRESQRVMGNTLALILLFAAVLPALVALGGSWGLPSGMSWLWWISPTGPFKFALEPEYSGHWQRFWWALAASQMFGWLVLAAASVALPRRWQERVDEGVAGNGPRWRSKRGAEAVAARGRAREHLLPINPVLWLMGSEAGPRRLAWGIVCAWGAAVLLTMLLTSKAEVAFDLSLYGVRPFGFLLKCLLALQACRFFVEARRNGALEMLLCTPLTSQDIIRGQVLALRRNFQGPVITLLVVLFVPTVAHFLAGSWRTFSALIIITYAVETLRMLADCYALGAFGMGLALTLKKPGQAPALTILYVLILPSILCWLDIFADLFFILWGMSKLKQVDLRSVVPASRARHYQTHIA